MGGEGLYLLVVDFREAQMRYAEEERSSSTNESIIDFEKMMMMMMTTTTSTSTSTKALLQILKRRLEFRMKIWKI